MKFFFIALSEKRKTFIEEALNVISSYNDRSNIRIGVMVRWTRWTSEPPLYRLHEKYGVMLFVDSAGFVQLVGGSVSDPMFPLKYSSWFNRYADAVDIVAVPDIPVHSRDKFFDEKTRLRLIDETIKRSKQFVATSVEKEKILLVLQGYQLEEYVYSYIRYMLEPVFYETRSMTHRNGAYYGVYAVGSVCVRKPEAAGKTGVIAGGKAAGTLFSFLERFLKHNWGDSISGFHFFGLHTSAVKRYGGHKLFYGSDSGAYALNFKWKWRTTLKCSQPDEKCYAKSIKLHLDNIISNIQSTTLNEFF